MTRETVGGSEGHRKGRSLAILGGRFHQLVGGHHCAIRRGHKILDNTSMTALCKKERTPLHIIKVNVVGGLYFDSQRSF